MRALRTNRKDRHVRPDHHDTVTARVSRRARGRYPPATRSLRSKAFRSTFGRAPASIARRSESRSARLQRMTFSTASWALRRGCRCRVLDREDWLRYADDDWFGTPHVSRDGDLVFGSQPADGVDGRQRLPHAGCRLASSRDSSRSMASTRGTPRSVARRARRSAGRARVARLFVAQQRVVFPSRWLEEAFASYVLVAVLGDTDPSGLRLVGSLAKQPARSTTSCRRCPSSSAGSARWTPYRRCSPSSRSRVRCITRTQDGTRHR